MKEIIRTSYKSLFVRWLTIGVPKILTWQKLLLQQDFAIPLFLKGD